MKKIIAGYGAAAATLKASRLPPRRKKRIIAHYAAAAPLPPLPGKKPRRVSEKRGSRSTHAGSRGIKSLSNTTRRSVDEEHCCLHSLCFVFCHSTSLPAMITCIWAY